MWRKLRELLLTAVFVAFVVLGLRALEAYTSRPLIYLEGTFPVFIETEGWMFAIRYSVDGIDIQHFVPTEARAKRFTAYLRRVGRVINDEPRTKATKSPVPLVDKNP